MVVRDIAPLLEASKVMEESRQEFVKRQEQKRQKVIKESNDIRNMIYSARERRENHFRSYYQRKEAIREDFLIRALKGIYLGAMNERTILDEHVETIADNMVRAYVKENGGATTVLNSFKGKTYLLDRIRCIVEEETEDVMENEKPDENDNVDNDTSSETTEEKEPEDDSEKEPENGEAEEESNETEVEVPEETSKDMYDKLEKEEDVHAAINIISQRISDAEEEFIRQNAEDKKKMEELADKVNERLQAVKDDRDMDEEDKEQIEQESTVLFNREKSKIMNDRKRTVLEQMILNLYSSIATNPSLKESYTDPDSGKMDTRKIVEAATTMYGFLETVNTLMIDNVDTTYIQKILDEMK